MPRPGPEDLGPFSFGNEQSVRRIIADAGFQSVALEPRDFALDIALEAGSRWPSRPRWHSDPQAASSRTRARKRVPRLPRRGEQVALAGAIWIVTANNA